ncbi:MAG TPA: DUF1343 domain-containing protein [Gemmatimonadaceae bacterium]
MNLSLFTVAFFVWHLSSAVLAPGISTDTPANTVAPAGDVTLGITVLLRDSAHLVRGKRVGLITNHTGRDERGRSSIDLLYKAPDVRLTALFAPEHGLRGSARGGAIISSSVDRETGVPIHSLYGATRVPTARMLENVDVLVYDIQDVGARMYTYVWTMTLAAEAAKKAGKKFIVVDRPDPIRADIVEGGLIEKRYRSFTGLHNVPLRYGLTPGELARYLSANGDIDADITVIPMRGYRRSMWWDETELEWSAPSPNIRDTEAALLYPGISFFEATNVSEGRGTNEPFRLVGARWLTDAAAITRVMNAKKLAGVRFESVTRRINRGEKFGGLTIPMIRIVVTDRDRVRSSEIGAWLLREIYTRHPKEFKWQAGAGIEELSGSRDLRRAVQEGEIDALLARWRDASDKFAREVRSSLLY